MNEAIVKRRSRRNFTKENLSEENIKKIKALVENINKKSDLTVEFREDGRDAFKSVKKSYGIFSNVHSLLMMKGKKEDDNLKEKVGYYGEELVLEITQLDLGTCWVGGTYDESAFVIPDDEILICVIVIGNIQKSLKDNVIKMVTSSKNRKEIRERIVTKEEIPDWIINGLEAIKLAPSALNSQKPTVYYEENRITMKVPNDSKFDMVDLGIAKKHFEMGVENGKFELGNNAKFILEK